MTRRANVSLPGVPVPWFQLAAAVLLGVLVASCATFRLAHLTGEPASIAVDEQSVRADLTALANNYALLINSAADQIVTRSPHYEVDRAALQWKLAVIPQAAQLAFLPETQRAFLAMVILSAAQRHYLSDGEGRDVFGAEQAVAVGVARELEEEAYRVGAGFLDDAGTELLRDQVEDVVAANPIRGVFSAATLVAVANDAATSGAFQWVVEIPMLPVRALSGVSDASAAVLRVDATARYFAEIVALMPEVVRWQAQLLSLDLQEQEAVRGALVGWQTVAHSSERLASAAETLPTELRATLTDLGALPAELRLALQDAERTIGTARDLSGPLTAVAEQAALAGERWTAALREIRAMTESDSNEVARRPFDIREYEATAAAIERSLVELRALAEAPRVARALAQAQASVDRAQQMGAALVNLAAWRAAQLLMAFFALLAAYKIAAARFWAGASRQTK